MKTIKKDDKLYIQAFREIRAYIIRNGLRPGDLLPTEHEMSEKLGVSRNVLREAIKSMELMGMVQACPGRGTVVREFSLDFVFQNVLFFTVGGEDKSVREMFGIRRMLELSYMRQAFHMLTSDDTQPPWSTSNEETPGVTSAQTQLQGSPVRRAEVGRNGLTEKTSSQWKER